MLYKLCAALAWASLAFIAYASLSPIGYRPHLSISIHLEHLIGFAFLGMVFVLAYPQRVALVSGVVIGSAVLLEYLPTFTPDRHGRLIDAVEKTIGGSIGIFAATVALLCFKRLQAWRP